MSRILLLAASAFLMAGTLTIADAREVPYCRYHNSNTDCNVSVWDYGSYQHLTVTCADGYHGSIYINGTTDDNQYGECFQ